MRDDRPPPGQLWLLLIHQLPSKPAYLRVKIWRRLQALGAVAVKSSVYALPESAEAREDFAWLLKEIVDGGGEAAVCEARLVDGLSDSQARALFDTARDTAYDAVAADARQLAAELEAEGGRTEGSAQATRLRKRLTEIAAIDFFGATGRLGAEAAVEAVERQLTVADPAPAAPAAGLRNRIWVTRRGIKVDRMACCWLIRRFIDPDGRFRFVDAGTHVHQPDELRFDMFEGEFTHEGDRCSLEVLVARCGLDDPAIAAIAEIIHDIDLKDGKFVRPEAPGVASLLAGIALSHEDDDVRLAQALPLFDHLHACFRKTAPRPGDPRP